MLLVIPARSSPTSTGFADAYFTVAGVLHGGINTGLNYVIGVLIVLTVISAGGVWLQGAVRVQAVAGLDGAGPLWLGRFSKRTGTPVIMNVVSAIIGSVFVALVFLLTSGSLASFFTVMVTLVISLTALMYFFMLPAIIPLRKKYPDHHRPFRVPGGTVGRLDLRHPLGGDHHPHGDHAPVARAARRPAGARATTSTPTGASTARSSRP